MKTKIIILTSGILLITSFMLVSASLAKSEGNDDRPSGKPTFVSETPDPSESPEPSETPEASESLKLKGRDRLEANRLRVCEGKEKEINKRATSLLNLVNNMLGKFDAITARVEAFYTNSGKTVANYNTLVADITAKKAAVMDAIKVAQADATGFSCTGDSPKTQLTKFRLDMQAVKTALHAYRTSIKNLIVAVRGVVDEGEGEESSKASPASTSTAEPTATPTASPTETPTPTATPTASPI